MPRSYIITFSPYVNILSQDSYFYFTNREIEERA